MMKWGGCEGGPGLFYGIISVSALMNLRTQNLLNMKQEV